MNLFVVSVNSHDSTQLRSSFSSFSGTGYYVIANDMQEAEYKALEHHIKFMTEQTEKQGVFDSDGSLVLPNDNITYFVSKIEFVTNRLIK